MLGFLQPIGRGRKEQREQRPRPVCDMQELADLGVGEWERLGTYSMYSYLYQLKRFSAADDRLVGSLYVRGVLFSVRSYWNRAG